ncbi:MAG TPA: SURF1 family protein [Actinomycetes bacterium]|nr:SURF1 family protein [Actinomycetes bacterium]
MARLLRTPKWLGMTLFAIVLIGVFVQLGAWQWDRSKVEPVVDSANPVASDPRLLLALYSPGRSVPPEAVGAPVVARGSYDFEQQLIVPGRRSGGVAGSWVLTPLLLPDGTAIPVVRGWVPGVPDSVDVPPPDGTVRVVGWLELPESDALRPTGVASLADDQIGIVSSAELLSRWPYDIYQGFVVLDRQEPPGDLTPVVPPAAQPPPAGIRWQNFGYAFQWWIFAAFVVFFWVRMLREDVKDDAAAAGDPAQLEEVR